MRLILSLLLYIGLSAAAMARPATQEERADIEKGVLAIDAGIAEGNFARMVAYMPPAFIAHSAKRTGMSTDLLKAAMVDMARTALEGAEPPQNSYAFDTMDIVPCDLETCRTYAFVPSVMRVKVGDTTYNVEGALFAVMEGGDWYFLSVDDDTSSLVETYPFMADVAFPQRIITVVE